MGQSQFRQRELSRIGQLLETGQLVPTPGFALGTVNWLAVSSKDPLMAALIAVGYCALDEAHISSSPIVASCRESPRHVHHLLNPL